MTTNAGASAGLHRDPHRAGPRRWRAGSAGLLPGVALVLALAGCASAPPDPGVPLSRDPVARLAQQQLGRPYRYGGQGPDGFDCSGLVHYAHWQGAGLEVPRTAQEQLERVRRVSAEGLQPGDLVFFQPGSAKDVHVGIYVQDDLFVHAPSPGKRVAYARLSNPFWGQALVAAGRLR
jgi:cell wall-associated NlpC family hydrolase